MRLFNGNPSRIGNIHHQTGFLKQHLCNLLIDRIIFCQKVDSLLLKLVGEFAVAPDCLAGDLAAAYGFAFAPDEQSRRLDDVLVDRLGRPAVVGDLLFGGNGHFKTCQTGLGRFDSCSLPPNTA